MSYSAIEDLTRWVDEDVLVQLSTDDPEATIVSEEVVEILDEMIESADSEIDSYLLGRWPGLRSYNPVPPEVNRLSAMIAVYNLYLRRRSMPKVWKERYEQCVERLLQATEGKTSLGLDDSGKVASEPYESSRTDSEAEDRVYTKDKLSRL